MTPSTNSDFIAANATPSTSKPKVFIGVPCFNNRESVLQTLESLRDQTLEDFEVLVSDDNSTDGSDLIIADFIRTDNRFTLIRQRQRLGLYQNLEFLSQRCNSEFFMWLASDDYLNSNFLEANYNFLKLNSDFSASCGVPYYLFDHGIEVGRIFELSGTSIQRVNSFLRQARWSHAIFYSLMRNSVLQSFPYLGKTFAAADWSLDLHLVLKGKVNTLPETSIYFGTSGVSRGKNANRKFSLTLLDKFFPLASFSIFAYRQIQNELGKNSFPWKFFVELNMKEMRKDFFMIVDFFKHFLSRQN